MRQHSFVLIGGDMRQAYLGKLLAERGEQVTAVGLERHGGGEWFPLAADVRITLFARNGRALTIDTSIVPLKTTRTTIGVQVMVRRGHHTVTHAVWTADTTFSQSRRYVSHSIPSVGAILREEDKGQLTLG